MNTIDSVLSASRRRGRVDLPVNGSGGIIVGMAPVRVDLLVNGSGGITVGMAPVRVDLLVDGSGGITVGMATSFPRTTPSVMAGRGVPCPRADAVKVAASAPVV